GAEIERKRAMVQMPDEPAPAPAPAAQQDGEGEPADAMLNPEIETAHT
ncbi:hypothetical protein C8D93_1041, partial [Sinimarinibacterium flocculans]